MSAIQLRMVTDPDSAEEIVDAFRSDGSSETIDRREVANPSTLGFDFGQVVEIVTLVQATFFTAPIIPSAFALLRRRRKQRLFMETPLGRVTIEPDRELDDDEIRALLKQLSGVL